MWLDSEEVRLGKADVEFRVMIFKWGEAIALPDRVQSADELIDAVIPRFVLDDAWEWAVKGGYAMSPIIMVSAPQRESDEV